MHSPDNEDDRATIELFIDSRTQLITKSCVNGEEVDLLTMTVALAKIDDTGETILDEKITVKLTQKEMAKGWKFGIGFHPTFDKPDDILSDLRCGDVDTKKFILHVVNNKET